MQSLLKGMCDQREQIPFQKHIGELAEWSNAAVLKTVDLNGSGGSNPSLSANEQKKWRQVYLNAIFFAQAGRDVGAQRRNPGEYFAQPSFVARAPPARDVGAQRRNNPYSRRLVALFMYLCHGSRLVR